MKEKLGIFVLVCAFLIGCQPPKSYIRSYTYVPNNTKAGDLDGYGALSWNHVEGMLAISPIKHLNITSQAYLGSRGTSYDLGIGGYYTLDGLRIQLGGGFGNARLNSSTFKIRSSTYSYQDTYTHYTQNSAFRKYYIQPTIDVKVDESLIIGLGSRLNWINYNSWSLKRITEIYNYPDEEFEYILEDRTGRINDVFAFAMWRRNGFSSSIQIGRTGDDFNTTNLPKYSDTYLNIALGFNLNFLGKD